MWTDAKRIYRVGVKRFSNVNTYISDEARYLRLNGQIPTYVKVLFP